MLTDIRLSTNFTLRELVRSDTAVRHPDMMAEQMAPPDKVVASLRHLTHTVLQPLRDELNWPIAVSSGYRGPLLNAHIGSSTRSQHLKGEAADIGMSNPNRFLDSEKTATVRATIQMLYREKTGRAFPARHNADFYLLCLIGLDLDEWDVDQLIHEFGPVWGQPAWVHVAASTRQNRRRITVVGDQTGRAYTHFATLKEAADQLQEGSHGLV